MSVERVLVANRGEIAVRVVRACRELGVQSVVVVSDADRGSLAARMADRSVCIGPARASDSYLNQAAVIAAALGTGSDAVHPGYGFLAENADFADACEYEGLQFIGPSGDTIRTMGDKLSARTLARRHGVPVVPGSPGVADPGHAYEVAEELGYPVLLKATAGGGGRGIRVVRDAADLRRHWRVAKAEAAVAFGDDTLYLERYVPKARHVEVQVLGDRYGSVVHLGERDCSVQRRYQKVIEEAPAVFVPESTRAAIRSSALTLTTALSYENAGTVEFLYDIQRDEYYFLEMNTRVQVEHPVTEMVTGLDLVRLQLLVASGDRLPFGQADIEFSGHAIECRIAAESPEHGFRPSPGRLTSWQAPQGPGVRVDTHCSAGYTVPPYYDSLLAKLVTHGNDRRQALERMHAALDSFRVEGIDTNVEYLAFLTRRSDFESGLVDSRWVEERVDASEMPSERSVSADRGGPPL